MAMMDEVCVVLLVLVLVTTVLGIPRLQALCLLNNSTLSMAIVLVLRDGDDQSRARLVLVVVAELVVVVVAAVLVQGSL